MKTKFISLAATLLLAASVNTAFADDEAKPWMGNTSLNLNNNQYYCNNSWVAPSLGSVSTIVAYVESQVWIYDINLGAEGVNYESFLFYKFDNEGDDNIKTLPLTWYIEKVPGTNNNGVKTLSPQVIDISGLSDGAHTIEIWFNCSCNNNTAWDSNYPNNYKVNFHKVPSLKYSENNDAWFQAHPNWLGDFEISGLTLYKDGKWNTICLPFNVNKSGTIFNDADVMTLESSEFDAGTLTLNFSTANSISAGVPYIVKWSNGGEDITNPVFFDVTINPTVGQAGTGVASFIGCFNPTSIPEEGSENTDYLYLGANDKLYYPSSKTTIKAFRAYFKLDLPEETSASEIKSFVLNFDDDNETTSIKQINNAASANDTYYTLDGRRLNEKPATAGLYIINGKKVVIK